MAQKWNLQDIRPAGAPKSAPREPAPRRANQDIAPRAPKIEHPPAFDDSDLATLDIIDGNTVKRTRAIITAVVVVIIVALGYFVNVMLGGAEVTVYPKVRDIFVQAEFTAYTNPKVGDLGYELLTLEATGEKQVKAAGKEMVSTRAEGEIMIYNAKSTSPQRLIKNTRFETPEGLIFRIKESIEVPGATEDAKGNTVPGSIMAVVFADGVGETYNIGPARFTVPGLKGTEQYDYVYAESTVGFTGGFEGEKYIIDEAELETAKQALHIELRNTLLERLKAERPAGFVIYENSVALTFEELPSTQYGDSLATIKELARLQVPIFREAEFAKFLADKSVPDYAGDPVTIPNPETLTFTYASPTTTISDLSPLTSLPFMLKGDARIIWEFNEEKLKEELRSIDKKDSAAVFGAYPSIRNAEARVKPFWETAFPDNPEDIQVETVIEAEGVRTP